MGDYVPVGIDINGLQDVAAFEINAEDVVGGAIPSVVIVRQNELGETDITAGVEATRSFSGRGWSWPIEGEDDNSKSHLARIPLVKILQRLHEELSPETNGAPGSPEEMFAAAVSALLGARPNLIGEPRPVIAIPDDGRFNEDLQQRILNAAYVIGLDVQLLWRSVAAVLGMADELQPILGRLRNKEIGVLSCLDDGISVSRLEIVEGTEGSDQPYAIPKRREPGRFFPYNQRFCRADRGLRCQ